MHTKGPWKLCFHLESHANDDSCKCGFRGHIWGSDREHVVCEMGSTEIAGQEGMNPPRYPREIELANARLIASAPELLEALEYLLEAIPKQTHDADWWPDELTAAVCGAQVAITKAEGK